MEETFFCFRMAASLPISLKFQIERPYEKKHAGTPAERANIDLKFTLSALDPCNKIKRSLNTFRACCHLAADWGLFVPSPTRQKSERSPPPPPAIH